MAGAVTDRDRGAKALVKRLNAKLPTVRVGVFGDASAEKHKDGDGATVGDIAASHEFGKGPRERSWLRAPVDANQKKIEAALRRAAEEIAKGRLTPALAMAQIGLGVKGIIQQKIADGIPPALIEPYLSRKLEKYPGATTPLIASGQFRQSIHSEVEK